SFLGIAGSVIPCALRDAHRLRSYADSATIQGLHSYLEALTHVAKHILDRHRSVLEKYLAGRRTPDAELVFEFPKGKARSALLDNQSDQPFVPESEVRLSNNKVIVGF